MSDANSAGSALFAYVLFKGRQALTRCILVNSSTVILYMLDESILGDVESTGSVLFAYVFFKGINPLYTGKLFHCYILYIGRVHFRGVESTSLFCRFYSIFDGKSLLANNVDPDQTPHNVASDLILHYLSMTPLRVSR